MQCSICEKVKTDDFALALPQRAHFQSIFIFEKKKTFRFHSFTKIYVEHFMIYVKFIDLFFPFCNLF